MYNILRLGLLFAIYGANLIADDSLPENTAPAIEAEKTSEPLVSLNSPDETGVLLNFSGTELRHVLQVIHQKTGERFLFDEKIVSGKLVTFFSDRPIQKSSLMPTLTSILEIQNLALVRVGRGEETIFKVVSAKDASKKTTPTFTNDTMSLIPDSDEVITLLYRLKTLSPSTLVSPLGKMAYIPDALMAIEGSRILKITDSASNVKRMVNLIEVMDENDYKISEEQIKVSHVLASILVTELQPMIDVENQKLAQELQSKMVKDNQRNRQKSTVAPIVATRPIVVQAIDRLSSIYLSGTPQQVLAIKTMIQTLDQPEQKRNSIQFVETKHRRPSEITPALELIYNDDKSSSKPSSSRTRGRRSPPPKSEPKDIAFQADDILGRIMVICPPSSFEAIKKVIFTFDQPGAEGIVRAYPLSFTKGVDIETRLNALYGSSRSRRGSPAPFTIVRDDANQSLIIRAPELLHQDLEVSISKLDIEEKDQRTLIQYSLEFTDAQETALLLANIIGHPLGRSNKKGKSSSPASEEVIHVDQNANALMIMANSEDHKEIQELIKTLDKESKEKKVTQYYRLKYADPANVSKNLRDLYPQPRGRRGAEPDMSVTIDSPTRTLIIKAEVSQQLKIGETVSRLDVDGDDPRFLTSYTLKHSDPKEAIRILIELVGIPKSSRYNKSSDQSDIITVDSASSSILVFAQQDTHNKVLEAMANIDVPNGDRYQTVFYTIQHADPKVLYDNMNEFFASKRQRWGSTPDLYLSLNTQSRTLMVKALPEKQKEVADAIQKLDIGGADPRLLKVYSLEYASPRDALRVLQGLLNLSTSGALRGRTPNPYPDLISIDEANASIVLFALNNTHTTVDETLKKLDVESSAEEQIVYYQTQHLPILEAVRLLSEMFGFQSGTTRQRRSGQVEKLILDENSNTMIITASPRTHAKVREVLKQVDVSGLGENEMRFYPIENTTALDAAKMIEQLFGLPTKAPRNTSAGERGLPLQRNPMVIPNIESNTLIINAPERTHVAIEDMLNHLSDIGKVDKMTVRFYPLENTNANDIAGQISELFSLKLGIPQQQADQKGRNVSSSKKSSGGALLRPLRPDEELPNETNAPTDIAVPTKTQSDRNAFFFDGEPTVIPEINLNSIILVAPSYLHDEVKRTLDTMDKRRPQVMIEVAIVEVTGGSDLDLGVEWSYLGKHGGVGTPFGLRGAPTGTTNLPLQGGAEAGLQGLVAGVLRSNGSMPVILNAVKQDKRMKIRSTPVLLVNDNELAEFSSLQEEPTTSTTQSNSSTAISFNGFVEAGTALSITPHISQGQYIRLEVDLKVESFTAAAISPGIPPPKSSSSLTTSVTVPDRQMVIVGGMVSEQTSDIDQKVPLLGDIPGLGHLFKRRTKGKTQSKLYLFISPKILRDDGFEDLREITRQKTIELEQTSQNTNQKLSPFQESNEPITTVPSPVPTSENTSLFNGRALIIDSTEESNKHRR